MGEIYALAVSEKAQNQGISTQLLDKIMQKALADNVSKVFALSRHNAQWFLKQGFVKMDISELPKKRQALFANTIFNLHYKFSLATVLKKTDELR
jgi:N-acetylglutamate synthase-like GNAT family acetyltransferase